MANRLTMAKIQAIQALHEQSWRNREIARELDVDRASVAKYVRAASCDSKPAKAPLGSAEVVEGAAEARESSSAAEPPGEERQSETSQPSPTLDVPPGNSKPAKAPLGSEQSKPAKAPLGSEPISGPGDPAPSSPDLVAGIEASTAAISSEKESGRSACEPYRQVILEKLELGLSAQRIYQDLAAEGFEHEYHSVRRFVAGLRRDQPSALSPHGMRDGRGGPGRFRQRSLDRVAGWQEAAVARLSHRAFLQPQGILRGGLSPDHRRLHSVHGECLLAFWRRAEGAGD